MNTLLNTPVSATMASVANPVPEMLDNVATIRRTNPN